MAQSYSIQPATHEDIPAIVACFYKAFSQDAIVYYFDNKVDPVLRTKETEGWWERQFQQAELGLVGAKFFKAVDQNG